MHEKKQKGDIGLGYAIAHITEQNWNVCLPLTEHASCDFIAEQDGKCKRVQVRYTSPKKGRLEVKLRSSWSDKNGVHVAKRSIEDFDVLAVYCPSLKQTFFLDAQSFDNSTSVTLRLDEPSIRIESARMASNYTMFPF